MFFFHNFTYSQPMHTCAHAHPPTCLFARPCMLHGSVFMAPHSFYTPKPTPPPPRQEKNNNNHALLTCEITAHTTSSSSQDCGVQDGYNGTTVQGSCHPAIIWNGRFQSIGQIGSWKLKSIVPPVGPSPLRRETLLMGSSRTLNAT